MEQQILHIRNCNNIASADISITLGSLNVKYAINGTGKSTIAKAIDAFVSKDEKKEQSLTPYSAAIANGDADFSPSVTGIDSYKTIRMFDESYVNQYVYQPNELVKNSFEIFVRTEKYDEHMKIIQELLTAVNDAFQNNQELDTLLSALKQFLDGCGRSKSSLSAAGSILKGLGKGNKISACAI